MRQNTRYRKPLLGAILFHAAILSALLVSFEETRFHAPPSAAQMTSVKATTVSQATLNAEIQAAKQANPAATAHKKTPKDMRSQPEALHKEKVLKAQQLVLEKAKLQNQQAIKASHEREKKVLVKQKAEKALTVEKAKKATIAKQAVNKAIMAKQQQLQQKLLAQQIASEQKNISQVLSTAQEGMLDEYKAQILSVIQSNWRIDKVDKTLQCVYDITLAPDGTVISENLVRSSGDDNLDQSAKQAIILSSPLPVPNDPKLFDHFRHLVLTLSPQGYLL